jgi:sugar phosphate permease
MMSSAVVSNTVGQERTKKYRWIVWGVIVLSFAIKFFHSLSMGVVKNDLMLEFGISESTFVSIGNVFFYVYLLMQIPTGLLVDTLGARKVASLGTAVAAIGITIFSFSHSLAFLYIGRGMVGLGTSVVFVAILKIQSTWFKESEFGTMTGITCFIGTLGGALAQTPLALLVKSIGWRSAFQIIGVVSAIVAVLILVIVRNKPEDLGMESLDPPLEDDEHDAHEFNIFRGLWNVLKNPQTWPLFLMYAGFYGSYVIIMGYYGVAFISTLYGKTTIQASKYIIAGVLGSAIGQAFIGNMSDRMKSRRKPLLVAGAAYLVTWAVMIFWGGGMPPEKFLIPLIFSIGFASCAYVISWPTVKEVNHPKYVGVSTSVANIGGFFGSIVLPPLVANVFMKYQGTIPDAALFQKAFIIVLGAVAIGFVASFFTKETGCRNIYRKNEKNEKEAQSI